MEKKIGFDVSETITKYPEQCKLLIDSLSEAGGHVILFLQMRLTVFIKI